MKLKLLGGILIISGTTIGAAMLALPISTGLAGFFPGLFLCLACWLLMTYSAFLFLEANLWFQKDVNIITMAQKTLGKKGELVTWAIYLFLLYSLTTAYIAAGGPLLIDFFRTAFSVNLPPWIGPIPFLVIFGAFVYSGTAAVDSINRILSIGLAASLTFLICMIADDVDYSRLSYTNYPLLAAGIPVVITSYGYHIVIPSLTTYFNRDLKQLKLALIIGGFIPFVLYAIWQFVMLGAVDLEGPLGIKRAYIEGTPVTTLLSRAADSTQLSFGSSAVTFFAIVTSFLGVSLSLSDFLADGLKIQKDQAGKILISALTFIPPLAFALLSPRAFFTALEYAGGFGVLGLLAVLPVMIVWSGRYKKGFEGPYKAPGGKVLLSVAFVFAWFGIVMVLLDKLGILKNWIT